MPDVKALGTTSADAKLAPLTIPRRDPGPTDVVIDIEYCGICHSDLHTAHSDWGTATYPCVTGHEIVGIVSEVGAEVTKHAVGDRVGVGCLVDSCGQCEACQEGLQNYCRRGNVGTYNVEDPHGTAPVTYGGYSQKVVVTEEFALTIPDGLDPAAAAPILCAGITMFSPLRHWKVGEGTRVGIAGFGGLGMMAVKLAKAMGAEVTVISRSEAKADDALKAGADHVLVSGNDDAMAAARRSLDLILSTVPVSHDVAPYLGLLKLDGTCVLLGALTDLDSFPGRLLIGNRNSLAGSMIGGIPETQEVLDFCAEHGVTPDIQVISADKANEAWETISAGDPGYRYVIDISTL